MGTSNGVELADIFRQHGQDYRESHSLPLRHLRTMRAVEICRTAAMGGHKDKCDDCGYIEISNVEFRVMLSNPGNMSYYRGSEGVYST